MKITRREIIKQLGLGSAALGIGGPVVFGAEVPPASAASDKSAKHGGSADVLVCGGGPAGIVAAYAAAKRGAKVILLERFGRLGGMAVQAMVGPLMGRCQSKIKSEILNKIGGPRIDYMKLDLQYFDLLTEVGVEVWLHAPIIDVIMDGNRVRGVRVYSKNGNLEFFGKTVIDATGDGDVAFMANVPFECGREEDGLVQPMSIMYTISGIDPAKRFYCGSEGEARHRQVNGKSWAQWVTEGQESGELPPTVGVIRLYYGVQPNRNVVNATQVNGVSGLCPRDMTKAEIDGRKQAYSILDFVRKHLPGYENAYIDAMPAVIGVRETRRFEGCARLEKEDCVVGRKFDDAAVFGASFCLDIHNPSGSGQAVGHNQHLQGEAERDRPYDIPYRCLLPKTVDGLLLAGRCISASHVAHSSLRVQQIGMGIGAGAGTAAAEAAAKGILAREVDIRPLQQYL